MLCDQGLCSRDLWAQIVAFGYPLVGIGRAFRDQPLAGTLLVWHAYGQTQPWVLLTNTPVAQTEPTLCACRNWIEQGFRGLKTVGGKWHKTRRLDPTRVGRHWRVLAIATLLPVAYGTRREEAEARHLPPGRMPDLTLPLTVAPADLGPATRGAGPPLRPPPPIPAQKIPLSSPPSGVQITAAGLAQRVQLMEKSMATFATQQAAFEQRLEGFDQTLRQIQETLLDIKDTMAGLGQNLICMEHA